MIKVENMINDRGNKIANQFILTDESKKVFQSYKTSICEWDFNTKTLVLNGDWWDYSNTTRKYFKKFINEETSLTYESKKQFLKEIEQNDNIVVKGDE